MKMMQRRRRAESPVDELLRRLDEIAASSKSTSPTNAATVAKRVRDAGEVPDDVMAVLAAAAQGPAGGSWILADPLLAALNRYSIASGGTDYTTIPTDDQRRRQSQETMSQRVAAAYEREAERREAARVRTVLGR